MIMFCGNLWFNWVSLEIMEYTVQKKVNHLLFATTFIAVINLHPGWLNFS